MLSPNIRIESIFDLRSGHRKMQRDTQVISLKPDCRSWASEFFDSGTDGLPFTCLTQPSLLADRTAAENGGATLRE